MSFSALRQRLEELSAQVQVDKQLESLNPDSGYYQKILNTSIQDSGTLVTQVVAELTAIPQLAPYNEGYIHRNPNEKSSTIKFSNIANWLLAQIKLRSPEEVVSQLEASVVSDSAPMSEVIAIWGLNPTSRINLTDDVRLVPINRVDWRGSGGKPLPTRFNTGRPVPLPVAPTLSNGPTASRRRHSAR